MKARVDRYERLLSVPKVLSDEMKSFETNRSRILNDFSNEQKTIRENYEAEEESSRKVLNSRKNQAESRFQSWSNKVDQYNKSSRLSRGKMAYVLAQAVEGAGTSLSPSQAIPRLQEETKQRARGHKKNDNRQIVELCERELQNEDQIKVLSSELLAAASSQMNEEIRIAQARYDEEHKAHARKQDAELRRSSRRLEIRIEREEDSFVERIETLLLPDRVKTEYDRMLEEQPEYEMFEPVETFPAGIQFGYVGYDVTDLASDPLKNAVISRRFGFALDEDGGRKYLKMPYGYSFTSSKFSTLFEFLPKNREQAAESLRNLALNLFMSVPVNKCWCTFIDPVSLGNTFAIFAPMGERDESGKGDERVIDTKIWSSERDIEERLKLIVDHTTDVIQRCLQGRYDNILDYNEEAGINAEPLRFLIVMDFPRGFSAKAMGYLESIIDNGPKTGVYTILAANKQEMENADKYGGSVQIERIRDRLKNTVVTENDYLCVKERTNEGKMRYFPFKGPTASQSIEVIGEIRKHLGEEIVITYPMISGNMPARQDYWFHKSALDGISLPVGMEGAGKIVNLEFGHPYHSFAAMLGGTIGSGKSRFLHTVIQGVLLNYKPEDVQMYLLDFKDGVEFKCYADSRLPNFRVVAVETEPEFGYAVLNELHLEMGRRSAKFRSVGVSNIESYWRTMGRQGKTHEDMPRLLIIFDEVQALLSEDESEISRRCISLIREIVTQGARAFGMHLILSTQTFENVKGLENGVYSNMHTRIALKSTKESAEILLDNENDVATRLTTVDPGQGMFNNNAGNRDANRSFRAAYITNDEIDKWDQMIRNRQMETIEGELLKPRILAAGPEDDSENPLTVFAAGGNRPAAAGDPSWHLYLGESLTMINTYLPALLNRKGQNLLVAGRDQGGSGLSRTIFGYAALSLLYEKVRIDGEISLPYITVFDLSGTSLYGSYDADLLEQIEERVPEAFRLVPPNMILEGIETLYQELGSGRQQFVFFYGLNRAKQLTTGTYERSPKEMLEELFAKGPEYGMNFVVWANDPGLFMENYGTSFSAFDHRLAYGMDDKEYKGIVGEAGPKESFPHNAVSFNLYGDSQKIRMYKRPTEQWLQAFLANIRRYVR
ncbi:MAG: FtsK/SpoIIIE domain-containing protein [Eubacteriales bacterium]|nr:FtsK/SpoIIIE domain-containing protein [Eubacteriales bacterium]